MAGFWGFTSLLSGTEDPNGELTKAEMESFFVAKKVHTSFDSWEFDPASFQLLFGLFLLSLLTIVKILNIIFAGSIIIFCITTLLFDTGSSNSPFVITFRTVLIVLNGLLIFSLSTLLREKERAA